MQDSIYLFCHPLLFKRFRHSCGCLLPGSCRLPSLPLLTCLLPPSPGLGERQQPFCTSPSGPADAPGTMGLSESPVSPTFRDLSEIGGQLLKTLFFGPRATSPNKGIFCWAGDNCFHLANVCCQRQCFLLEANVWWRRQCQAKYFLRIKIPLIF